MRRLTNLSYDDWIEHVFSHDVRTQAAAWYFDLDADLWAGSPEETVAHLTRLFEDPEPALFYFSDAQIDQGLRYIIDNGAGDLLSAVRDVRLPLKDRLRCVGAIRSVYDKLFLPRCTPHLSHLDQSEAGSGPLNTICYMWWDIIPGITTPDDPHRHAMNDATFGVLQHALALESIACQESALHGLGHWTLHDTVSVSAIIDAYLRARRDIPAELGRYARAARNGCIL